MNTNQLIKELERLRVTLKFKNKEDEDVIKIAIHRLETEDYKRLVKEEVFENE